MVPPLLVAVVGAGVALAVLGAHPAPVAESAALLVEGARRDCLPEPQEMLAYVLGSVGACAMLFAFARFAPALAARGGRWTLTARCLAVATTAALGFLAFCADFVRGPKTYRGFNRWDGVVGLAAVAVAVFLARRARRGAFVVPRAAGIALTGLVLLVAIADLLASVYGEGNIVQAIPAASFHLPYTLGEFAAPAGGRTPLVDFHAQYVNLLPLVAAPLVRATKGALGPFTALMAACSLATLAGWWTAARQATGNAARASLVLLPVVILAAYVPDDGVPLPPERGTIFVYYALAPLRLFLPGIGLPLVLRAVRSGGRGAWVLAGLGAGLAALNNADFGVVFAATTLVVAALFAREGARPLSALFWAAGGIAAGWVLGSAALALHGGAWPSLRTTLDYQRAFAAAGFYMLPLHPREPLQWLVFATHLAAVAIGLVRRAGGRREERLRAALLVFAGLNGLGTGTYYVGRSHELVLVGLFMIWAFSLTLLAHEAWCAWRDGSRRPAWLLVPSLLLAFQAGLFVGRARQLPNPVEQVARLAKVDDARERWFAKIEAILRENVPPGGATDIVYPDGHVLALRAGVDNRYEFAHPGSLILLSQLDAVAAQVARLSPPRVFGTFPPDLAARLTALGYRKTGGLAQTDARMFNFPEFEIWSR